MWWPTYIRCAAVRGLLPDVWPCGTFRMAAVESPADAARRRAGGSLMFEGIAQAWYRLHYQEKISPALTVEQKHELAKKISDFTLYEPFQFTGKNYSTRFPE